MNLPTPNRQPYARDAAVMRTAAISNDAVDHLPTLRAARGSNPQQASKLLRQSRVALLAERAAEGKPLNCV